MRGLVRQKIVDSLAMSVPEFTRRDVRVPNVPGKAYAVIGMRRSGKTAFLWQVIADRVAARWVYSRPYVVQDGGQAVVEGVPLLAGATEGRRGGLEALSLRWPVKV